MQPQAPDPRPLVERADPRARRRAVRILGVLALAGVAGILLVDRHLDEAERVARRDPAEAARLVARLVLTVGAAAGIGLGLLALFAARLSRRILVHQRFPPPGALLVRDVRVVTGSRARALALAGFVVSALMAAAALALPLLLWRVAEALVPR